MDKKAVIKELALRQLEKRKNNMEYYKNKPIIKKKVTGTIKLKKKNATRRK